MLRRTTRKTFALIVGGVFTILALGGNPAQAEDEYKDGVRALNEKRYAEAKNLLLRAIIHDPGNVNALYYLALSEHYQGKTGNAIVRYQEILRRFPGTDAANRALQALQGIGGLAPGATDAQNYPKAKLSSSSASSSISAANAVHSYGSTSQPIRNTRDFKSPQSNTTKSHPATSQLHSSDSRSASANLPSQATIYFEPGDAKLKVDGSINNRPVKMVFDTGATGVVIGKNQLEELGIKPPEGAESGLSSGSANDSQQAFWTIKADIKVGTINRPNFPIKVLSYNSGPPLLGQTFIQDFEYSIDRNVGVIRLKRKSPGMGALANPNYAVPFKLEGTKMVVTVEVNGQPYSMYFDTGNSASAVNFAMSDLKALHINPDDSEAVITGGVTGTGSGLRFKVKKLKLGPIEKFDVPVIASYSELGKPLVGQDLYEGYEYTVDNDAKVIHFIRR